MGAGCHRIARRVSSSSLSFLLLAGLAVSISFFQIACRDAGQVPAGSANSPGRLDSWTVIGPGGGGAQFLPTISPHDENTILVRCDMTGSYLSFDAGESWRMFNLRGPADFFVFDPVDPRTLYAHTIGLFRSRDAGNTWELVYPSPSEVSGIAMPSDHADERLMIGDEPAPVMTALAVDPSDSKLLYASVREKSAHRLERSDDAGVTWTAVADLPGAGIQIAIDPRSKNDDRDVYVVTERGVLARKSGEWRQGPDVVPGTSVSLMSAGFDPATHQLYVYAIAPPRADAPDRSGSLMVSRDGGSSWESAAKALDALLGTSSPRLNFRAVAAAANVGSSVYLSFENHKQDDGALAFGVMRSDDGARTWRIVWQEAGQKSPDVDDGWISAWYGPGWGDVPFGLGVAPANPEIAYATDFGRTLRTTDGGKTWKAVYTRKTGDSAFTTNGMDVTTAYGVHFDPFNPQRMLISYTDIGAFLSEDGGRSWTSSTWRAVPRQWSNTAYWMEFDPEVKGRLWAVFSGTHDLPRPKMWRRTPVSRYRGGVAVSDDGGRTWSVSNRGMPETAATHLMIDTASPKESRTLYVAGFGTGVFKSVDGGATWLLKNQGIIEKEPFAWRLAMDSERHLYLVIARRSEDGSIGDAGDGNLYRSTDGADSWQPVPLPADVNGPNGLLVDPENSKRLYLAAWGRRGPANAIGGGVFVSDDAGQTWRHTLSADQHIYDVTVDPQNPSILYACGFESSVWKSTDRGESWKRIPGYNFKWGHRVIPDPADASKIYVTTFGGSVWHGPADGDPDAHEDIVTPQVGYRR